MGPSPRVDLEAFLAKMEREMKGGFLAMLILQIFRRQREPLYGYGLLQSLQELSNGKLIVYEGTIYPMLHTLEQQGLLRSEWVASDSGPPRRYYRLTMAGEKAAEEARNLWGNLLETARDVLRGLGSR